MGMGSFVGGAAKGVAAAASLKSKTSKPADPSTPNTDPKFSEPDMTQAPTDAQIAANQADLNKSGLADGGLVGPKKVYGGAERHYGKRPCK